MLGVRGAVVAVAAGPGGEQAEYFIASGEAAIAPLGRQDAAGEQAATASKSPRSIASAYRATRLATWTWAGSVTSGTSMGGDGDGTVQGTIAPS